MGHSGPSAAHLPASSVTVVTPGVCGWNVGGHASLEDARRSGLSPHATFEDSPW